MPRNKYTSKRIALNVNNEQLEILRLFSEKLQLSRTELLANMLQLVVCPVGGQDVHFKAALDLVRAPFGTRYWARNGVPTLFKGDERLIGESRRWDLDLSLDFWSLFFECSEGIRPVHNMNTAKINMRIVEAMVIIDGVKMVMPMHAGPIPRNRDEYTRLLDDENGMVPLFEPGHNRRRERGFARHNKCGSHAMMPFMRALCMHTFSTNGEIPVRRAVMLAAWAERLCQHYAQKLGFHAEPFDDKARRVNKLLLEHGDKRGLHLGTCTPAFCLQSTTPLLPGDHHFFGLVAPKWRSF